MSSSGQTAGRAQVSTRSGCGRVEMYGHQYESFSFKYSFTRKKRPITCGGFDDMNCGGNAGRCSLFCGALLMGPSIKALMYESVIATWQVTAQNPGARASFAEGLTRNEYPVTSSS